MDIAAHADRIWRAVQTSRAIPPLTDDDSLLTVDSAYQIQDEVVARHVAAGAAKSAVKLGLTSVAKQRQMNVSEPLYGWLTDTMQVDGAATASAYIQPRIEPEIALILGDAPSGPDVTAVEVLAATEAVAPTLDILDSRFAGYRFTLADVAADNSSAAGYVLGAPSSDFGDLALTGCVFERNGEPIGTAAGAAVMDHPANAVAWFLRKLHSRGQTIPSGCVILAGAWTAATPMEEGVCFKAEFDRIGSVEVAVR